MYIVPITPIFSPEATQATQKVASTEKSLPFSDVFSNAIENLKELQAISNQDAYNLAMGDVDDLHTVMINTTKASTALELTVQLTSKAVNAYNEIMKMQI